MKTIFTFFAGAACLATPLFASAANNTPPLETIIAKVIARDDANQKELKSLQYHQTLQSERLDDQNHVTKKQNLQMIVRPGADPELQVTSEKGDDLPTDPDQASLQAQGKKAQSQKVDFKFKDIVTRFTVTLQGNETLNKQPVYVLAFEPKPDQPYRNQTEKVLNHLRGKMWVRTSDYSIIKTDASLAEPVSVAWVFAKINALTFTYELNSPKALGPAHIQTSVQVSATVVTIRQRMTIDITRFEPRTNLASISPQ